MGFHDVGFCPSRVVFSPHFLTIVLEVEASGPPHVLKLWLGVIRGILSKISLLQQSLFVPVKFH